MQRVNASRAFEHLRREVDDRPIARRSVGVLAGIRLQKRDQLFHATRRRGRMDHEHQRRRGHHRDVSEVLDRVVLKLAVEIRVDGVRSDVLQPQRVTVGRRLDRKVGRDGRAGAGFVLDDHLLAELLGERYGDRTAENVGDSAGGETDHESHRLVGIVALPERHARPRQQHEQERFHESPFMACHNASTSRCSTPLVMKTSAASPFATGRRRSKTWRTPCTRTSPSSTGTTPFTRSRSFPRNSTSVARKCWSNALRTGCANLIEKLRIALSCAAAEKTWSVPGFASRRRLASTLPKRAGMHSTAGLSARISASTGAKSFARSALESTTTSAAAIWLRAIPSDALRASGSAASTTVTIGPSLKSRVSAWSE